MAVNILMYTRLALEQDIPNIIDLINSHEYMYGINLKESGLREKQIQIIHKYLQPDQIGQSVVAVDDEENVLGICVQSFGTKAWILEFCYIRQLLGKNQYNASKIGGVLMDKLCECAEDRGLGTFYYAVRDSKNKRLSLTLSATANLGQRYEFKDIEKIPPLTKTTNELVAKYILGTTNGLNKKPIIIRCGYLK
jgi:predicted N-acetyltransferase YhbS